LELEIEDGGRKVEVGGEKRERDRQGEGGKRGLAVVVVVVIVDSGR
jgi:hypothetical protein